jgi:hypothetical protein
LYKSLISKRKRKGKEDEKNLLKNQQKELFQFIRDQETKKNGIRQRKMKINLTSKRLLLWKSLLKV